MLSYFTWRSNRQANSPWRPAAKEIEFPWPSILSGFCLAAGRQGLFPWRFWYFPWRFLAAKAILVWCSYTNPKLQPLSKTTRMVFKFISILSGTVVAKPETWCRSPLLGFMLVVVVKELDSVLMISRTDCPEVK